MAQVQELKVEARAARGKGPAFQARLKGLIPGVVYGGEGEPENVAVDGRTLERHVEAGHFLTTLFMLDVDGKKTRVIPRRGAARSGQRPSRACGFHAPGRRRHRAPGHSGAFQGPGRKLPGLKKGGVLNIVRHEMA